MIRRALPILAIAGAVDASLAQVLADAPRAALRHTRVVMPDLDRIATLRVDGRRVRVPIEHVWRTMCFGGGADLTYEQLAAIAIDATFNPARPLVPDPPALDPMEEGGIAGGGLNIDFIVDASVPGPALAALTRVEQIFEQTFTDDLTVRINLEFDNLPPNVLGATGAPYTNVTWNISRNGLQNDMDDNDRIQSHLPAGPRIPVRYNALSAFITQENRVFWTLANFNAAVGFIAGDAGNLRFNQNITWDYDPDDGVIGFSFIDVLVHEVGHVLGFASGVDFRVQDIESLDIFRFQRTDGGFDWNPDNYGEFQATARTVDFNLPDNDCLSDIIIAQYKMEDGDPFQASHFKDKIPPIGIMDPVLGGGETFRPQFLRSADKRMFDAIGWDR